MSDDRILSPDAIDEDGVEVNLRPQTLNDFIGHVVGSDLRADVDTTYISLSVGCCGSHRRSGRVAQSWGHSVYNSPPPLGEHYDISV